MPGTKQITGWKSLFASTRWNKLSSNEQLKRIGKYIDGTVLEHNEKINPLLVWYYKLKKQKLYNNICDICGNEFKFYKKRFEKMPNECFECNPDPFQN